MKIVSDKILGFAPARAGSKIHAIYEEHRFTFCGRDAYAPDWMHETNDLDKITCKKCRKSEQFKEGTDGP